MKYSNRALMAAAASLVAMMPATAFAEGSAGGPSILIPNMAEFVPALIAFLIILVVLSKLAWPKVLSMMEEREKRIADSLDEAERTKQKAIEDRAVSDALVTDARRQAADIVLEARQDAEAERARIIAAAHAEAEDIIAKAHATVEEERRSLYADAAGTIADLSVSVAAKIVEKSLDEDGEQRRLIEQYLKEAGSLNAN
ncbi:F0F1 ATP synthase subunit B [Enorma phocaeensis]|jgi:F-type H+-transporting ATPase subunit b|uniref:ATP synthase subunit b n=1 Tax=Enorma phocaeensis TaxID=1871019 RepID=A0ABT7VCY8_9ACTN|nr:F0F1 ATP synthase subunit B [Enorma phocaeensis]MBM6953706.1 F0F1 ATP synthase subunit B [Enorma phocaeensis]MDM8275717.1 F0F1 ATP synthase subunit B [Enorma phocaeensis]